MVGNFPCGDGDGDREQNSPETGAGTRAGIPVPSPGDGEWGPAGNAGNARNGDRDNYPPMTGNGAGTGINSGVELESIAFSFVCHDWDFPSQSKPSYQQHESHNLGDNPTIRKGLEAITSSLNHLGDTFEKAFEEGRMIVESKTAELKTQIRLKGSHEDNESQLKASREVAMATAAKAKLLLRELKTVKADLAFAKARCSQLEEENKMLRDCDTTTTKGQNREDDDMIRFQLETLLAEKARLAGENEVYARKNHFLREIVEYHQLTMQDVVYLDDGIAKVSEVYDSSSGVSRITSFNPSPSESPLRVVIRNSESSPILPNEMLTVIEKDSKRVSENEAPLPSGSFSKVIYLFSFKQ
ncbi:uncharacterized protein [Arachis hypogaea]|nr:uncharacterized protein LOC112717662 [Arachis hypogaea]